ncbi:uncharacterized protein [Dermacentor andersoni]|uniref:uncharacterized protein isoform X6 n=1 Tax=Dermacentor andersoni TaxID=34620 RepID=UPI003B3B0341
MKHIVFLTACVLLFLVATSAEDQDDEETDQDDEETEEDRRFDKNFNVRNACVFVRLRVCGMRAGYHHTRTPCQGSTYEQSHLLVTT